MFLKKTYTLALLLFFSLPLVPFVRAQEGGDLFSKCQPKDYENLNAELIHWLAEFEKNPDFDQSFEAGQKAYHDYMACLFEVSFKEVLKQAPGEESGEVDWMKPAEACISEDALITSMKSTSPAAILPFALKAMEDYQFFLLELDRASTENVQVDSGNKRSIPDFASSKRSLLSNQRRIENEIKSSLIARDVSLNALKEMRLAFVAHIRFQCILRYLEAYRQEAGRFRRLVEGMPRALQNASLNP